MQWVDTGNRRQQLTLTNCPLETGLMAEIAVILLARGRQIHQSIWRATTPGFARDLATRAAIHCEVRGSKGAQEDQAEVQNPYQAIPYQRLHDRIVDQIVAAVKAGVLKPGDALPSERELMGEFGVSRTPLREAVRVLAEMGLVSVEHGKGMFITRPPDRLLTHSIDLLLQVENTTITELWQVRRAVEQGSIRLAARRATAVDLRALERELREMEAADMDVPRFARADCAFHLALSKASKNAVLVLLTQPMTDLLLRVSIPALSEPGRLAVVLEQHWQIYQAVRAHDEDRAEAAMRGHLESSEQHMLKLSPGTAARST